MHSIAQTSTLASQIEMTLRNYESGFQMEEHYTIKKLQAIQRLCITTLVIGSKHPTLGRNLRFTKHDLKLVKTMSSIYHLRRFRQQLRSSIEKINALCKNFCANIQLIHINLYILVNKATLFERICSDLKKRTKYLYLKLVSSLALAEVKYPPEEDFRPVENLAFKLVEVEKRVLNPPRNKKVRLSGVTSPTSLSDVKRLSGTVFCRKSFLQKKTLELIRC